MARKRLIMYLIVITMLVTFVGCVGGQKGPVKYEGPFAEENGTLAGVDSLGRVLPEYGEAPAPREDRYVGLFYFLWQGQHGLSGPHDNWKIVTNNPDAILSEKNWIAAGGGPVGAHHFWAEPLFGYYTSDDVWVMHKHVQMLTDAGVDFLTFDTTNAYTYSAQAINLIKVLDHYYQQGWNVPKISFYTNSSSGQTLNTIYRDIYEKYPEYEHLWFFWEGKPLAIGHPDDATLKPEVKEFFRIKKSQWPNEVKDGEFVHHEDGFPWMNFEEKQWVFRNSKGEAEVMSVSLAQHNKSVRFSRSAWYDPTDNRTRSWRDGENDQSPDAFLYGYNFANEFEYAIQNDPKIIFITGWNEWVAQRQPSNNPNEPIVFVDCADPNNSRDAEPMKGGFGDNYYMQMMYYIRKFKGVAPRVNVGDNITIDVNGGFEQWNNVPAVYKDYTGDTVDRDANGFGVGKNRLRYTDETGRNDFELMKVARDKNNIYFYVQTVEDITPSSDPQWMNLFISTGGEKNWEGYDFVINRKSPSENEAVVEKSEGGWNWTEVGKAEMKVEGNKLMLKVPKSLLDISSNELVDIRFKWADNYQLENDQGDIFSFYLHGDCAPYGRLNYIFSEVKK